jgi:hypothetical protein
MNPVAQIDKTHDFLYGPKTYELIKNNLSEDMSFACTSDDNSPSLPITGAYIIDLFNEVDILEYMAKGSIPIVHTNNPYVKDSITGIKTNSVATLLEKLKNLDTVVDNNIRSNLKYINILRDVSMFEYLWKKHMELCCPLQNMNGRNSLLLYFNFSYMYFLKNIEKISGIEDKQSKDKQYKVVLLDNRPNPLSVLSVLFTLSNLNMMWSCKIYTSKKGVPYYEKLLGHLVEVVELNELNTPKFHIDIYNNILKSPDFWKSIDADKTLIIQDDGVLLKPGIDRFMEYDYIGASWVDNVNNEYIKKNITADLVGNGGFSLRTNDYMIQICEKFQKEKTWLFYKNMTQMPEDVYFIYGLKKLADAKLPTYQTGTEFASEEICNMNSIGIHKMWAYHMPDVTMKFLNAMLV